MQQLQAPGHFIGRTNEIEIFTRWLEDAQASKILYFHDAVEEAEKKGGVGKTWLLRRCADLVRKEHPDINVVMLDFFNLGDRDRVFLAGKIMIGLQELYPAWSPVAFTKALQEYREEDYPNIINPENVDIDTYRRNSLATALATDLLRLEQHLEDNKKKLLVIFDTFEVIEQNPTVAVLRPTQTFPDDYQFAEMRFIIAGRNKLDWTQPNWKGREQEVQEIALTPFSPQEMTQYLESESAYTLSPQSPQAIALHERTEGRPILIGLAIDVLNHRILTLDELVAVPKVDFESYLVTQINKLENPLNWVILFMAHVYHRFNVPIMEWILQKASLQNLVGDLKHQELHTNLPQLSFVRRSSSGEDFTLHDEMRRLVKKYCWAQQDPDLRYRKEISRSMIGYYEQLLEQARSEQEKQAYIIEMLYHQLFLDIDMGLHIFQQHFNSATRMWKSAFAGLLLQETQKFSVNMSPEQAQDLRFTEAKFLRIEQHPAAALHVLETLEQETTWRDKHLSDLLLERGRCYIQVSSLSEATNCFTKCLEIARAEGNETRSAHLLGNLGYINRRRGRYDEALRYYEQSIALHKKLGDQRNYANILNNMSAVYRLQGKIEEALRRCKVAWRIRLDLFQAGKVGEIQVALCLNTLGQIYLDLRDAVHAEQYFQEALDIYNRAGNKKWIAATYNRLGQIHMIKEELEQAKEYFEQAQVMASDIDTEQYITSLNRQGQVCTRQQHWEQASTFFEQAIDVARQVRDDYQQVESLIGLARTSEYLGRPEQAQQAWKETKDIASRRNYLLLLGQAEEAQAELHYHARDYTRAFEHFAEFCHYMALYNTHEYTTAVQKVMDALMGVPNQDFMTIIHKLTAYWLAHGLEELYPELTRACNEVEELMTL